MKLPLYPHTNSTPSSLGFTLIELLVAVSIFTMVLIMTAGIFSRFIFAQRHDIGEQAIQEDMRLALELMNRELRTSYASTYRLADIAGQAMTFRNQNGLCVHYRLSNSGQIERAEAIAGGSDCDTSNFSGSLYGAITSSRVNIEALRFDVVTSEDNGQGQPNEQGFVTIMMTMSAKEQESTPMHIQSTIASRQFSLFQPGS